MKITRVTVNKVSRSLLVTLLGVTLTLNTAQAANFGGPDAVENTIADDAVSVKSLVDERLLEPWFQWKQGL